jgi:hypothetical protein
MAMMLPSSFFRLLILSRLMRLPLEWYWKHEAKKFGQFLGHLFDYLEFNREVIGTCWTAGLEYSLNKLFNKYIYERKLSMCS